MEQIWTNLETPSWWFTGIFFIVVGWCLKQLAFNWLPYLLSRFARYIPEKVTAFTRWKERRVLIEIKNARQRDMEVVWYIGRYWALFISSMLYLGFVLTYFSLSADVTFNNVVFSKQILILIPFYVLMFIGGVDKKVMIRIMDAHHAWKLKNTRSARLA